MLSSSRRLSRLGISILLVTSAAACLWDRDTITDELQTRATQYDLSMGQFPSHGDEYYFARIKKLRTQQKAKSLTVDENNDLAVAYIRTKQFTTALALLNQNLKQLPNHYATLSNISILHKKQGSYTASVPYMKRALAIKPEGHMGLGDWYLKRLRWSAAHEKENGSEDKPVPTKNFLGEAYSATDMRYVSPPSRNRKEANKKRATYLTKLLKNDRHFPDAYVVFGDLLWQHAHLNLAMRCYQHALHLKHPNPQMVQSRIDAVIAHWGSAPYRSHLKPSPAVLKQRKAQKNKFLSELKQTEQWLANFHAAEANLVRQGKFPTFLETEATLKSSRHRPKK
ncbi:MAG: tetratricopeptide repeat protein [Akkermansiaceae bacterium]